MNIEREMARAIDSYAFSWLWTGDGRILAITDGHSENEYHSFYAEKVY